MKRECQVSGVGCQVPSAECQVPGVGGRGTSVIPVQTGIHWLIGTMRRT